MPRFPDAVITAMHHAGTTVTCIPVQLDQGNWVAAIFFVLPEQYDESVATTLFKTGLIPVALEADLKEPSTATLISLGIELRPPVNEALSGEVLFIPGHLESHHEAVRLLSKQTDITLFVGDKHCNLLHQQKIPLADEHRAVFADLLREAASRDALIRFRGQYDPDAAFVEVTRPH
ncbi:MAG: hypothetical protein KTR33_00170 [Gammaproteobacteria bacterium]|nr:hypothetical protein [Gammaproteobacteria bacterium]